MATECFDEVFALRGPSYRFSSTDWDLYEETKIYIVVLVLGRFAKLGPKTPLNDSHSTNDVERTYKQPRR
jgi:hypothetical protein